ncbi:CPBP family intramembrane metalloprotease [Desertihabitans brevis]|uniref:CPBP family intramembrane metalloprotease n=1 Tax=Desertihabitans brevis TaxID=2268447 RepID=A0A367YWL6_9ACTN|nr:CPBP family intramembrane glutamic endopeptidase [Desertihabitans brevis]RCK70293.1 CPBP family intramembrane metalloprotease [Desertihabitans brevis]
MSTSAAPDRPRTAPGWPELLVGLAVLALVAYGTAPLVLTPLGLEGVARGLALGALSGVAGIIAFLVALALRVRRPEAFGVRGTTVRWLLLGALGGLVALVVARIIGVITLLLGIQPENIQQPYTEAGSAGVWSVVLSLLFLALLTPLGEELLFRGVVTTVLLRYGAVVGVVGSAVVFALMHGINAVSFSALVVGLVAGELRRRSGSVWPGVVVHVVNNAVSQLIALLLAGLL